MAEVREALGKTSRGLAALVSRAAGQEAGMGVVSTRILLTGRGGVIPWLLGQIARTAGLPCERLPNPDCLLTGSRLGA